MLVVNGVELKPDENNQVTLRCSKCNKVDICPSWMVRDKIHSCIYCGGELEPYVVPGGVRYTIRVELIAVDQFGDEVCVYENDTVNFASPNLDFVSKLFDEVFDGAENRIASLFDDGEASRISGVDEADFEVVQPSPTY